MPISEYLYLILIGSIKINFIMASSKQSRFHFHNFFFPHVSCTYKQFLLLLCILFSFSSPLHRLGRTSVRRHSSSSASSIHHVSFYFLLTSTISSLSVYVCNNDDITIAIEDLFLIHLNDIFYFIFFFRNGILPWKWDGLPRMPWRTDR